MIVWGLRVEGSAQYSGPGDYKMVSTATHGLKVTLSVLSNKNEEINIWEVVADT